MKFLSYFLLTFSLLFTTLSFSQEYLEMIDAGTYSVPEIQASAEAYFAEILEERSSESEEDPYRGTGYKPYKRWEYTALKLMDEDGYLKSTDFYIGELKRYEAYRNSHSFADLGDNWTELGPDYYSQTSSWAPGVGRITAFSIDENDEDHIVVGAQTGGVWKTTDGGQSWIPLTDYYSNMYVYSIAIQPGDPSVYYFGSYGGRIYRSTDAGATWSLAGTVGSSNVNRILIHPTNTDLMFATTENVGLYRSTDGGSSWSKITDSSNDPIDDGRGFDFRFKPGDTDVVYASGTGVHKSTDGGATFSTISGVFDDDPKMIGVSADDPDVVYILEADGGAFGGLYKSTDNGSSFSQFTYAGDHNFLGGQTDASGNSGQAPRDMAIAVNPSDVDEVHIAGINTWRSTDGGASFSCTSNWRINNAAAENRGYCHADIDIMDFYGNTLYLGTDGGFFKADNTGGAISNNFYTDLSGGLGIRQFYKIGVSQTDPVAVTGGSQDNGTSVYNEAQGWRDWLGADGMETFVRKDNNIILFGTSQYGNLWRSIDGGGSAQSLDKPNENGNWVTPMEQDPFTTGTLYTGYNRVHKSTNSGVSWTPISQNIGANPSISNLKIAPSDNNVMYASRVAALYKTTDGGATDWEQLSGFSGIINFIAIHPTDPDKVAIATNASSKVFVSKDGGDTWTPYFQGLPNFAALTLAWQDNGLDGLYLGMNYGIYYIDNTFETWQPFNNNMPNVIVYELEINYADGNIYAGTYGRGLWVSPLYDSPDASVEEPGHYSGLQLYPNPARDAVHISWDESATTDVRIFDNQGKLLHYGRNINLTDTHTVDVSGLPSGVYYIRLNSKLGVSTRKLIVK